jgi:AcrR family transcriptional regulator
VPANTVDDNPTALQAIHASIENLTKVLGSVFIACLLEQLIFVPFGINLGLPRSSGQGFLYEMVQKAQKTKRRGRPRAYEPEVALQRALEAFWKRGYSGTTLDDLAAATGMNRPSLYAGFGDKRAIYVKALEHYWERGLRGMRGALTGERPLQEGLRSVYEGALSIYFSDGRARGCFAMGTATAEVVEDPQIRAVFMRGMTAIDECFEARFRLARDNGELPSDADPETLAGLASAILSKLAIRARSGTPRAELWDFVGKAVDKICAG